MLHVFRESGFPIEVSAAAGQLHVTFPTAFTHEAIRPLRTSRSRSPQLTPSSSSLIRAQWRSSAHHANAARSAERFFITLLSYGFQGPVYPVNPTTEVVQSVPAYASVEAIPGPVDLAIIVVPAEQVIEVATACGRKGLKALVVISAGFSETGAEGQVRQAELVRVCRASGMRLIGPNCMGIANTDSAVHLDATFAPTEPEPGRVGFSSQSGALGLAILEYCKLAGPWNLDIRFSRQQGRYLRKRSASLLGV